LERSTTASITLPEAVKDLFAWLKAHDQRFAGTDAAIAAFLMERGAEAYYQQGLEVITPLDANVHSALAEIGTSGIRQVIIDEESSELPETNHRRATGARRKKA
jgi:hypothetical protein